MTITKNIVNSQRCHLKKNLNRKQEGQKGPRSLT